MVLKLISKALNIAIIATALLAFTILGVFIWNIVQVSSSISIGKPSMKFLDSKVELPMNVSNPGPFSVDEISTRIVVFDEHGVKILEGATEPLKVGSSSALQTKIVMNLNISKLPAETIERLLTENENLSIEANISMFVFPVVKITGEFKYELPWGAPLHELKIGRPKFSSYNVTHLHVLIPISFKNENRFIPIDTKVEVRIFNATSNVQVGFGYINVKAPPTSSFSGNLTTLVKLDRSTVSLLFNDKLLRFKVEFAGTYGGASISFRRFFDLNWGAPISNLKVGVPSLHLYNLTHVKFALPLNFTNNSEFITAKGSLGGIIFDSRNNVVGLVEPLSFNVSPKKFFSGELVGYVKTSVLFEKAVILKLTLQTGFGSVEIEREMIMHA
ncbi:MAG: hypothetical protein ACP5HX_08495 [Thermoproteota archaeon]